MKNLNEAERMIFGAAKIYLLSSQGKLVFKPKDVYYARYEGLRDMALALGATTQSRLEEIAEMARRETYFVIE